MTKTGYVYYKNDYAGVLEESPNGNTCFTYNDSYLGTIACSLPRHGQSFTWKKAVHPFFENLAPEGWLRSLQARGGSIQAKDTLGMLLAYGKDCIGAVGIRPKQSEAIQQNNNYDVETRAATTAPRTISGVQRKLLAYKKAGKFYPAEAVSDSTTHIAKLNSQDNHTLVQNESLSLRLASNILGQDQVTKFTLGSLQRIDEISLLVERFDRTSSGEKLRMEEFAQILNKPCGNSYSGKYQGSYEEIALAIKEFSSFPVIDLERFFRQLVFSILVGNCDAHFKNFALIETNTGLRLAPAYDILNTLLYPEKGYSSQLALEIAGAKRQWDVIDRKIITDFGQAIGLTKQAIELALSQIENASTKIQLQELLEPHPLARPDDFKTRYKTIFDSACHRIFTT